MNETIEEFADSLGFTSDADDMKTYELVFGALWGGGYEESVFSILRKDGQLYEYEDGHCSCNGFSFNPKPVTVEYVKFRAKNSKSYTCTDEEWAEFQKIAEAL